MPRDRDNFRKYENGFDKQKKKAKRDKFLESQTGALVKFLRPIGEEVDDHDVTQTHDDTRNKITPRTSSIHAQKTNSAINESLVDQSTVGSASVDATSAPDKTISRTTESLIGHTWAHLGRALDNHEKSAIHGQNVGKWTDCEIRLAGASTIDKQHMKLINEEKEHWREVLKRIIKEEHDALDEVVETTDDPKAKSEAGSLDNEIKSYELLLALAIWYDVLFTVNSISKNLQAEKMYLGMASQLLQGLVQFFEQFTNEGFVAAIMVAREMSELLDI
ncbi:hypothetical protein Trydic_g14258 [Trypoxylus dichotomus]